MPTDLRPLNSNLDRQILDLPGGLKLYALRQEGIKTLTLHAWVRVGSLFETPEVSGISHFLEHMLFRGNQKLGDSLALSLAMEELGGEINAATGIDQTEYWLECHQSYLEEAIRRFSQFLRYPLFEQIDTEKKIILEEIKADFNEQGHLIDGDQVSAQLLWPDSTMGLPISGTNQSLKSLGLEELKYWYQTHYTSANLILGISGDFEPIEAQRLFAEEMTGLSRGKRNSLPLPKAKPGDQICWVTDGDSQYSLHWTFLLEKLDPQIRLITQLISRLLDDGASSRLQRIVREEKGLVYDIRAQAGFYPGGAYLCLMSQVGPTSLTELTATLADLFKEILAHGFTQAELDLCKLRFQTALDCYLDSAEGRLHELVAPDLFPCYLTVDEISAALHCVDLAQVNELCRQYLTSANRAFVFIGPEPKKLEAQVRAHLGAWYSKN